MPDPRPLSVDQIRRCSDPAQFTFETTADLEPLENSIGQERALEALHFGLGMGHKGYNLYLLGPSGTGKHTTVSRFLGKRVEEEPVPDDWCYVHNFEKTNMPLALRLPAGRGRELRKDMADFVDEMRAAIPGAFASDDYRTKRKGIEAALNEIQDNALKVLRTRAQEKSIALVQTPAGMALAPIRDGEVLSQEAFAALSEEDRAGIETKLESLQGQLQGIMGRVPKWVAEKERKMRALNRDTSRYAVDSPLEEMRGRYQDLPAVLDYLTALRDDILENADDFLSGSGDEDDESEEEAESIPRPEAVNGRFRRYRVNLFVDHRGTKGAPVVYEDQPTHKNLIGRIEHVAHMGSLVTDFNLIKAGALHRANGGYLIVDAHKVLTHPYAWEELKRVLRAGEIRVESLTEALSVVSTVSIEPTPIPLEVKVLLVGERRLYYMLQAHDPDFAELFKVPVDFAERLDRTDDTAFLYARMVGTLVRDEKLKPFDRAAVARVVEYAARLAADSEKLSTHMSSLADLVRESDFWASDAGREVVAREDVERAVAAWIRRADRARERVHEQIHRGTVLIDNNISSGDYNIQELDVFEEFYADRTDGDSLVCPGGLSRTVAAQKHCRSAARPLREPGLRAVLRRRGRRQRLLGRALRAPLGAGRSSGAAGVRGHRIGQSARRRAGHRRREREDRGLLRHLPRARADRRAGRVDSGRQREEPHAALRRGRGGGVRAVPHLSGGACG